jgi:hypothetical protein
LRFSNLPGGSAQPEDVPWVVWPVKHEITYEVPDNFRSDASSLQSDILISRSAYGFTDCSVSTPRRENLYDAFAPKRWELLSKFIRSRGGVVVAEELALYLDPPQEEYEQPTAFGYAMVAKDSAQKAALLFEVRMWQPSRPCWHPRTSRSVLQHGAILWQVHCAYICIRNHASARNASVCRMVTQLVSM